MLNTSTCQQVICLIVHANHVSHLANMLRAHRAYKSRSHCAKKLLRSLCNQGHIAQHANICKYHRAIKSRATVQTSIFKPQFIRFINSFIFIHLNFIIDLKYYNKWDSMNNIIRSRLEASVKQKLNIKTLYKKN